MEKIQLTLKITNKGNTSVHDFNTDEIIIGRHRACDVILFEKGVSRHHATIKYFKNAVWLSDNESLNGTFLNKIKIEGEQKINNHDVVEICGVKMEVIFNLDSKKFQSDFEDRNEATIFTPKVPNNPKKKSELIKADAKARLTKPVVKKSFFDKIKTLFSKSED